VPRCWRLGIVALALLLPTIAQADPKDDARRHFAAGLTAAQEGNFEIALQRFLAAQEAYPHPATLYNIAQAYMDLDDLANAKTYWLLFRDADPDKAPEVDPILLAIDLRMGSPTSTPTAPMASPSPGETGPVRVVVTGPTEEEIARLETLAAEFEALVSIIKDRQQADREKVELAQTGAPVDDEAPAVGVDGEPVPDIPTGGGFIGEAYEKIVVTASRVGQDPLDSPSTLTVLTAEDVRLSGAQNITDLLRRVVGVDVMVLSSGHADMSIRGFNRKVANKVLILIDGRSTYTDFAGLTFVNGLPISLEEIERIEVIRGPGSAVYGANAMTGVVNIITKTPGENEERIVTVDAGHPDLGRATVLANGSAGDVSYRLSAGYQAHGRWSKELELTDRKGNPRDDLAVEPFFEDQDTGMRMIRANGRIDQQFGSKSFASLSGGITDANFELYNLGALPNYGVEYTHTYLRGDLVHGGLHLRSFWNSDHGRTGPWLEQAGQNRSLDAPFDNDAVDIELEGPIEFETGAIEHTLSLGVGYRFKRIEFGDYLNNQPFIEHHQNAFVNEQISVGRFGGVASLRVDKHPYLPLSETVSPRSALLYRIFDKTSLRATFGTAFRAPNALESYMDFDLNNPAADGIFIQDLGGERPSATRLRPERITTYELGIHDESSYVYTADAVVYMNRVRDLIELSEVDPEINFFNAGAAGFEFGETGGVNYADETYVGTGFEAEVEVYPTDGLDVYGNVDLAQVMINNPTNPARDGTRDRSMSGVKVNLGSMYRTPWRMDLTYDLHFVGPQTWSLRNFDSQGSVVFQDEEIPARTIMTARVAGRPFTDERLELAATAWNFTELFGDGFKEHPDGQYVHGRFFGTVTYRF